jgi:ATP-binding cassette subfamily B protein
MSRALAPNFKIMLLDEATSNYDNESRTYINQILKDSFPDQTCIIISHHPDILKQVDRIVVMHQGVMVDMGGHKELYHRNLLYRDIVNQSSLGETLEDSKDIQLP